MFLGNEPIRRFNLDLIRRVTVLLSVESDDAKSYDKMLELFRTILRYMEINCSIDYVEIIRKIDINSLDRNRWKKTMTEIQKKVEEDHQVKEAARSLVCAKNTKFNQLINKYRDQGYEIVDK